MALNMTIDLIRNLDVDVWLKVGVVQRESRNLYRNIFAYNINLCSIIDKGKGINVLSMWVHNLYKYTNMPMSCPIEEVCKL